jgi:hypothetical protein
MLLGDTRHSNAYYFHLMPRAKGLDEFQRCILAAMQDQIRPLLERDWAPLGTVIQNHLLDLPGPTELNRPRTGRQLHVGKMFRGFAEILKSVDTLQLIEMCIGRAPARSLSISQDRYLQFFYEAYLHELYVLQQRLFHYLKTIERQFRRNGQLQEVKARCEIVSNFVIQALENVVKVRGSHVHVTRAYDKSIDRLGTMTLLTNSSDIAFKSTIHVLLRDEARRIRKQWRRKVTDNNTAIGKLLDTYFEALQPLVFENDGAMKYPNRLKF